jgi:hypothetical protein
MHQNIPVAPLKHNKISLKKKIIKKNGRILLQKCKRGYLIGTPPYPR